MTSLIVMLWGAATLIWMRNYAKEIEEQLDRIEEKMEVQE